MKNKSNLARALAAGFRARLNQTLTGNEFLTNLKMMQAWSKGYIHADRELNNGK